jgi:predicted phage tail protein
MCTAGTLLFTCNGVSIELPADPATTVPPTAQVVLHGRPTAAGQFGFKIIATPANGVGGCTREYRLNIVLATDTQAPTVPAGLSATLLPSNVIRLNWSASTDNVMVTGYLLRQTIGTGATAVTLDRPAVNALTFDVAGVAPGKLYTYLVRAVDAAGNSSAFSQPAVLSTPVAAGPSPPSSLIVN